MPGMIKREGESLANNFSHSLLSLQSSSSSMPPEHRALDPHHAQHQRSTSRELKAEERGLCLIHLLYSCANAVASGDMDQTNVLLEKLSSLASLTGDPMQRVATYFMEALAARTTMAWPGLYKALYSTRFISVAEVQAARQVLFNVCPYAKFGFLTVNQSILDAMQGEKVVHVVDLEPPGASNVVVQWEALLQAFNSRPEGPPHLRITAVNENREVLNSMGQKLAETADRLDIPFQFHAVVVRPQALERDMLGVKIGEAVAISSLVQLHRLLAIETRDQQQESQSGTTSKRPRQSLEDGTSSTSAADRVLRMLHSLKPKVMVVVEQESNHNGASLLDRFAKALHYYSAVFDSLDSTLPHNCNERIALEKIIFGQEIRNIVSCEGVERVERHESLEFWKRRFEQAKFTITDLSPTTVVQAERLLSLYTPPNRYKLQRIKGALTLCWQDTPMFSVSAWETSV